MHEFLQQFPLLDALWHSVIVLPFIYGAYLIMEVVEHYISETIQQKLSQNKYTGFLLGGCTGLIPLCGVSDLGACLYAGRIISVGTLIALFISTSGEALLVAATQLDSLLFFLFLLLLKFLIACIIGFIVDCCFFRKQSMLAVETLCKAEDCHCDKTNIWLSALKHTLPVFGFLTIISLGLSLLEQLGYVEVLITFVSQFSVFGIFFAALIGLIPSCSGFILLLELWQSGILSAPAFLAGSIVFAGTGYLTLIRANKNLKQNISIIGLILTIATLVGLICEYTGWLALLLC